MKAVVQSYRSGAVQVEDVPVPHCPENGVLVRNIASLVSVGTERSMIELGRKSLIGKARARPDLLKRALEKGRREGYWKVFQESLARLDSPVPLGYSSAGVIVEVGVAAHGFSPGQRVACVGHTFASHAEFASVPSNMACPIPEQVSYEEAAFCMLGAIAMHGVRTTQLALGGRVAVIGLGLLGLLAAQILRAYGCEVFGMDPDPSKVELCKSLGISEATTSFDELSQMVALATEGSGCDAVVVAAATKSADPVNRAVALCREKGRIVVLGVADIHPDRNELWKKEIELIVSKAGGAGALDPLYEIDGIDLPIGVARWTQGRNVQEFLRLLAEGGITVDKLITHRFSIDEAGLLYKRLVDGELKGVVGAILQYSPDAELSRRMSLNTRLHPTSQQPGLAVLGAGLFGRAVFLPALAKSKAFDLKVLVTNSGVNAAHEAKKFGFRECATDSMPVYRRQDIHALIGLLPHSQHAKTVHAALDAGKHLLIEKPLCIDSRELAEIRAALAEKASLPVLMVGHNRRYSRHVTRMKEWLGKRSEPLVLSIRVNAGYVPAEHWVHKPEHGRSRIIGECTHFIDLAVALAGCHIHTVQAIRIVGNDKTVINNDNVSVSFRFTDGSIGALVYTAEGPRTVERERIEVFWEKKAIVSTDFRRTEFYTAQGKTLFSTRSQNYGYEEELTHFAAAVQGKAAVEPPLEDTLHVMASTLAIEQSLAEMRQITV